MKHEITEKVIEKFWKNIENVNDCWIWVGPISKGKKTPIIHKSWSHASFNPKRVSLFLEQSELINSFYLLNTCQNNLCVNPKHIYTKSHEDLFWEKVNKTESCWIWTGGKEYCGYGVYTTSTKNILTSHRAHRYAYELLVGPIPNGLFACHKCDNRACVNPEHIFLGTAKDNAEDRDRKERCVKRLFTDEEKKIIYETCNITTIAKQFNVSVLNIAMVIEDMILNQNDRGE